MIAALLMLLLLMNMMGMLLMMLGRPCGPVRSFISGTPVQPPIPGVSRSPGAAITSRSVNGWRAGWSRLEGAGGRREALLLIQRMMGVMQMMMMMVVVVSRFRHRISAGSRSVTDGVFHKGVHVVHMQTGGTVV